MNKENRKINTIIEFAGVLSDENMRFLKKQQLIVAQIIAGFTVVLSSPFIVFIALMIDLLLLYFILLVFVLIEGFALFLGLKAKIYPLRIAFYDDSIDIVTKTNNMDVSFKNKNSNRDIISNEAYKIDEISCIKDLGSAYNVKFKGTKFFRYCLCQKDLITKGTIEEFEEVFKDLIVKRR